MLVMDWLKKKKKKLMETAMSICIKSYIKHNADECFIVSTQNAVY